MNDLFSFKYNLENCRIDLPEELKRFEHIYQDIYSSSDWEYLDADPAEDVSSPLLDVNVFTQSLTGADEEKDICNFLQPKENVYSSGVSNPTEVCADEPAVVLDNPSNTLSEKAQLSESGLTSPSVSPTDEISGLWSHIYKTLCDLKAKQEQIDAGSYVKSGPGRKRKFGPKNSKQLKALVMTYLRNSLGKIISNRRCKDRKDALITIYFRALKKLTYHLVEKWAAKNLYKRNEVSKYLIAFAESHISFLFSISEVCESQLLESFVEYIIVYFPTEKATEITNILIKQKAWDEDFLRMQLRILEKREKTSKKSIKEWASNSSVLRQILHCALEVLSEPKFANTRLGEHLINTTKFFIY